tara:strand:- start:1433 stop:1777 length:345 start_codon:yes stop_codon:yes gene_type:complete
MPKKQEMSVKLVVIGVFQEIHFVAGSVIIWPREKKNLSTANPDLNVRGSPIIEEKLLYLRKKYHFGQARISWYLKRYHDLTVSIAGVYTVLLSARPEPASPKHEKTPSQVHQTI